MRNWGVWIACFLGYPVIVCANNASQPTKHVPNIGLPELALAIQGDIEEGSIQLLTKIPLHVQKTNFFYGTLYAQYTQNHARLIEIGLENHYRLNKTQYLECYLSMGRLATQWNNVFWLLNPGVEWLATYPNKSTVGLQINTYLPISPTDYPLSQIQGQAVTDTYYNNHVKPHAYYQQLSTVRFGGDVRLSYIPGNFWGTRLELGIYLFNHSHRPAWGLIGDVHIPLSDDIEFAINGHWNFLEQNYKVSVGVQLGVSAQGEVAKSRLMRSMTRHTQILDQITTLTLIEQTPDHLAAHQAEIAKLLSEIKALEAQGPEATDKIKTLQQALEDKQNLEPKIVALKQQLETQETELIKQIEENKKQADELQMQIDLVKQKASTVADQNSKISDQDHTIREQLTLLKAREQALADQGLALKTQRQTVREQLIPLNQDLGRLNLSQAETQLTTLEQNITALRSRIAVYTDLATFLENEESVSQARFTNRRHEISTQHGVVYRGILRNNETIHDALRNPFTEGALVAFSHHNSPISRARQVRQIGTSLQSETDKQLAILEGARDNLRARVSELRTVQTYQTKIGALIEQVKE